MVVRWKVCNGKKGGLEGTTETFTTFPQQTSHANFVTIDPFHLDFHACAMDWHAQSAGSRGEQVSWVADRASAYLYFPSISSSENLAFYGSHTHSRSPYALKVTNQPST